MVMEVLHTHETCIQKEMDIRTHGIEFAEFHASEIIDKLQNPWPRVYLDNRRVQMRLCDSCNDKRKRIAVENERREKEAREERERREKAAREERERREQEHVERAKLLDMAKRKRKFEEAMKAAQIRDYERTAILAGKDPPKTGERKYSSELSRIVNGQHQKENIKLSRSILSWLATKK